MLKNIAKRIIPLSIRIKIRKLQYYFFGVDNNFKKKSNSEIFDKIYQESMWGLDEEGKPSSGTHDSPGVSGYISVVTQLIENHACDVVVDLGCGDFKIGQHIVSHANSYIACDVSKVILAQNKNNFDLPNVNFRQLDLSQDSLPQGDIATVREVLQHLSNESIQQFINEINSKQPFKWLLVTEHNPMGKFTPNIDKPSGPHIRAYLNSGVVLHESPFNLNYKTKTIVYEDEFDVAAGRAVVISTLYELK